MKHQLRAVLFSQEHLLLERLPLPPHCTTGKTKVERAQLRLEYRTPSPARFIHHWGRSTTKHRLWSVWPAQAGPRGEGEGRRNYYMLRPWLCSHFLTNLTAPSRLAQSWNKRTSKPSRWWLPVSEPTWKNHGSHHSWAHNKKKNWTNWDSNQKFKVTIINTQRV